MAPKSSSEEQGARRSSAGPGRCSPSRQPSKASAGPTRVQKVSKNKVPVTKTANGHVGKSPPNEALATLSQRHVAQLQERKSTNTQSSGQTCSRQANGGKPVSTPSKTSATTVTADRGLEDLRMRYAPDTEELFRESKEYSGLAFKDDKNAGLRFELRILHDVESGDRTRLFYQLRIYLSHKADGQDVRDDEIGHFECYRLSKPTAKHVHVEPLWLKEYLRLDLKKMNTQGHLISGARQEIAKALQALYSPKTVLPKRRLRKSIAQALKDNSILYLNAVYIREPYTGNRLLPQIMTRFCSMLGALPEWFAFAGNVILTPGWLNGDRGQQWDRDHRRGYDDGTVVSRLEGAYKKAAFETWVDNVNVEHSGDIVTVMGRIIPGDGVTIMADASDDDDDDNDWCYSFPADDDQKQRDPDPRSDENEIDGNDGGGETAKHVEQQLNNDVKQGASADEEYVNEEAGDEDDDDDEYEPQDDGDDDDEEYEPQDDEDDEDWQP